MCKLTENCNFCEPKEVDLTSLRGQRVCPEYLSRLYKKFPTLPQERILNPENLSETLKSLAEKNQEELVDINRQTEEVNSILLRLNSKMMELKIIKEESLKEQSALWFLADSIIKTEEADLQKKKPSKKNP